MSKENEIYITDQEIQDFFESHYDEDTLEREYVELLLGQKGMLEEVNEWQASEIKRLRDVIERMEFEALQYSHNSRVLKMIETIAKDAINKTL